MLIDKFDLNYNNNNLRKKKNNINNDYIIYKHLINKKYILNNSELLICVSGFHGMLIRSKALSLINNKFNNIVKNYINNNHIQQRSYKQLKIYINKIRILKYNINYNVY
jgi:hypothetical protein